MNRTLALVLAGLVVVPSIANAQGRFWVYQGVPTGTQSVTYNAGAVTATAPTTRYLADDVNPIEGYTGQNMVAFSWAAVNGNPVPLTVRHRIRWHDATGTVVGPTGVNNPFNYINGLTYTISLAASSYTRITGTTSSVIPLPPAPFWMGITYDNNSNATGATVDQLNLIGCILLNPTIGTSTDTLYRTTNPSIGNTNPISAGAQFQFTNNTPLANIALGIAVRGQDFTGDLTLQNVGAMAGTRTIGYVAKSGTTVVTSGTVVVGVDAPSAVFTVVLPNQLPASISNPIDIEFDGSSFLKKRITVSVPGDAVPVAIPVGSISLINGDVDNSGEVDAADIDAVIAAFGATDLGDTDVDVSGEVDAADIDIVIANFGATDE